MKWNKIPFTDIFLEASNTGLIRDGMSKKLIRYYTTKNGYQHFSALVNGKKTTVYVHRCVLSANNPIDGYKNYDVHHKDHNPSNNNLKNLVWCTPSENFKYSYIDGRFEKMRKAVSVSSKKRIKDGTHIFFNLTEEQHRKKYKTRSSNYKKNGNHPNKGRFGLNGTNVKLTEDLIHEIKKSSKLGEHKAKIARRLNLSRSTIYNVLFGLKKYT